MTEVWTDLVSVVGPAPDLPVPGDVPDVDVGVAGGGEQTLGRGVEGDGLHPSVLLQGELRGGEVGGEALPGDPPHLDGLVLRPSGQQAVIKRREGEVRDQLGVSVNTGNSGLLRTTSRGERQHCQAGAQTVPVEGDEGSAGRYVVPAGVVGADGQVPDVALQLRVQGGRVLVLGGFEPPGHGCGLVRGTSRVVILF